MIGKGESKMKIKSLAVLLMIVLLTMPLSDEVFAQAEIKWQVISCGGTEGSSTNYDLNGTSAQTAVGHGNSDNYDLGHGFWQTFGGTMPCQGICGNANDDPSVNVADAVWIINYVFAGGDPPEPVPACGNANGNGGVNVADAVWIINFVFAGGDPPGDCDPGNPLWTDGDCCPYTP